MTVDVYQARREAIRARGSGGGIVTPEDVGAHPPMPRRMDPRPSRDGSDRRQRRVLAVGRIADGRRVMTVRRRLD